MALENFDVDCTTTGTDGLTAAMTTDYSAILLDLRLPDISGLDVLERLILAGVRKPVVVLTGFRDAESAVKAMKLGAVDVLFKPVFADDVTRYLRSIDSTTDEGTRQLPFTMSVDTSFHTLWTPSARDLVKAAHTYLQAEGDPLKFVVLVRRFRMHVSDGQNPHDDRQTDQPACINQLAGRVLRDVLRDLKERRLSSVRRTADRLLVSLDKVREAVKACTGGGYRECRLTLRVGAALLDATFTSDYISQVAYRCGYDRDDQFCRDFRRPFGVTPGKFRKALAELDRAG
jgi:DNA-binding response OmpR family regulator